jgi:hypothetical protein
LLRYRANAHPAYWTSRILTLDWGRNISSDIQRRWRRHFGVNHRDPDALGGRGSINSTTYSVTNRTCGIRDVNAVREELVERLCKYVSAFRDFARPFARCGDEKRTIQVGIEVDSVVDAISDFEVDPRLTERHRQGVIAGPLSGYWCSFGDRLHDARLG